MHSLLAVEKIETEHYQHPEIERLKRLIPTIKKWFWSQGIGEKNLGAGFSSL
jgi:hypothetical protein